MRRECTKCGAEKDLDEFNVAKRGKYGRGSRCRACAAEWRRDNQEAIRTRKSEYYKANHDALLLKQAEYRRNNPEKRDAWRKQNSEHVLDYRRRYRAEHLEQVRSKEMAAYYRNRDKIREQRKVRYQKNRVAVLATQKARYAADPQVAARVVEKTRQWRKDNPQKAQAQRATYKFRRRTRLSEVRCDLTSEQWELIKAAYQQRCAYCGKPEPLEQDHVVPVSLGGEHTASNIVPSCGPCNRKKHARMPQVAYQQHLVTA